MSGWRWLAAGVGFLWVAPPSLAQPGAPSCGVAPPALLASACERQGIPPVLARAVIQVESGGHPYALRLNVGRGRSLFPGTHADAVRLLRAVLPITTNIDIGLMQVNAGIWGGHFQVTAVQLLDPATNLRVGCAILRQALATPGPAWQRLGRYHSGNARRQRAYARRVTHWLARLNPRRP